MIAKSCAADSLVRQIVRDFPMPAVRPGQKAFYEYELPLYAIMIPLMPLV